MVQQFRKKLTNLLAIAFSALAVDHWMEKAEVRCHLKAHNEADGLSGRKIKSVIAQGPVVNMHPNGFRGCVVKWAGGLAFFFSCITSGFALLWWVKPGENDKFKKNILSLDRADKTEVSGLSNIPKALFFSNSMLVISM